MSDAWNIRYGVLAAFRSFRFDGPLPLLKTVHAVALDFRVTGIVGEKTIVVANALPGSYGEKYGFGRDFGVPATVTVAHRVFQPLTLVAGVRYDPRNRRQLRPVG